MISPRFSRCRITKVVCPSCEGSGESLLGPCGWCDGQKRMKISELENWCQWIFTIAVGGYIAGDHDLKDMTELKEKVNAVREIVGWEPLTK